MDKFKLRTKLKPKGDQPQAIEKLTQGIIKNDKFQTLLGVTGSGKTFTMANVIVNVNKPTLVISHNKTLAAQLYAEFKDFFPENAVEYFVSYYDYYQPEAYIPATDTYIEKDASINDRLDRLRLSATTSLLSRKDAIIVSSVSCIYNLGSPEEYKGLLVFIEKGQTISRDELLLRLIRIQYERSDMEFVRGKIRVRGDIVEVFPAYKETAIRISLFGDTIQKISEINPISAKELASLEKTAIYPAKHFIVSQERINSALASIEWELEDTLRSLKKQGNLLEAQRLQTRTRYDMDMLKEIGYCHGIENYSRHLSGRNPGSRPHCLIDYFPKDFLLIIDESHATIPQIGGMYKGDKSRKETLVNFGFRLPSCLDNRPLRFAEFESLINQVIFVSATPADYEIEKSEGKITEQIIRPTGLVDPEIILKPSAGQIDDLIMRIKERTKNKERTLVTTLTKRMAEDLSQFLQGAGIKVSYLHSEIETIERTKILKELRSQKFDCLVGINLLREGLDLPEVSLVAILDADKEGFLRSTTSLIQVAGRAARHINGQVLMYADIITKSIQKTISESNRRRKIQLEYNKQNNIIPRSIEKAISQWIEVEEEASEIIVNAVGQQKDEYEIKTLIAELEYEMELAARNLQFEKAAEIRDKIKEIKNGRRYN